MTACKQGEPGPHRWAIEEARGRTSQGVCLGCGWVRDFENSIASREWGEASPAVAAEAGLPPKPRRGRPRKASEDTEEDTDGN